MIEKRRTLCRLFFVLNPILDVGGRELEVGESYQGGR